MKKIIWLLFITCGLQFVHAEKITYSDSWGKQGLSVLHSGTSGLTVNFSITSFNLQTVDVNGTPMQEVHLARHFLPNDEGKPNLPGSGRYVALPQNGTISYTITASRVETISDIDIAPAPHIPFDTEDGPLIYLKDDQVYNTDAFYPQNPVLLSEPKQMRGVDVALVGITPFQYNPVTRELRIYRDMQIDLTFEGGDSHFGRDRLRNRNWDTILSDMLLNFSVLPKMNNKPNTTQVTEGTAAVENVEYLIISPDDPVFLAWADSLKLFRNQQGIKTGVITTTEIGGNNFATIESYIDNAYYNWTTPPSAVLLLGDYGQTGSTIDSSPEEPHPYSGTYVSDNYYADVDGDDLPDIVFSRITAQTETHLQNMVGKILDYERNPPTNPDFYAHPVTAMGWQTERWFQICSEVVNGFWEKSLGKQPVRENAIYSGDTNSGWSTATNTETVVDYFGPNGLGYIPATPDHLTDWGGNATRINNDINAGAFMVQHRDHGSETSWGEPSYSVSDMSGLHNTDPTFVFSVNCLTGEFNLSYECFAEAFHRDAQRALGLIAATQVSYSFVNDTYTWGMYDNMWPQFMPDETTTFPQRFILPSFANAAGKYFLQQSSWPYNTDDKQITYYLFHHHGDAYSMVYSEVPQNLTVTHNSVLEANTTKFSVTADDGSIIALTVDGEIIGTADGTGAPVDVTIPPQQVGVTVLVTITKQNYYRYSSEVPVINSSGAYVTVTDWSIDDSASGNNNQQADFGESVQMNVTVENQGSEAANGVNGILSSSDTYLTITDDSHLFGDLAVDAVVSAPAAFGFDVAANVPDQHSAACAITFTADSGSQWTSNISVTLNAPALASGDLVIDDSATGNNDGKLDEGETVDFHIPVTNTGHATALACQATLSEASAYITISNATVNVGDLAPGDTAMAVFEVTADPSTAPGTSIDFTLNASSGAYSTETVYTVLVGDKVVYLMHDGSETVRNGLFYDTGGSAGDYSTGEDITLTFYPADRSPAVYVNFTAFDVASYDKLYIFDGPTTSSPQITGSPFSGTTSPGEFVSTSSDGAITFRFRSNPVITGTGWAADISSTAISAVEEPGDNRETISDFALLPNYPNPFNPTTTIRYQLAEAGRVVLDVFNTNGQQIARLVDGHQNSGIYAVPFDAAGLSSGVYFYRLQAGPYREMRKMILMK